MEVDKCQTCKGVWFDKDELRQAKDITDSDLNWMDFEIWKHEERFKAKASQMKCPVCKTQTQTIDYGATAVEVDYCPTCTGVWLDENEFKKIIESLEKELNSKSFSEYIKSSIEEAKEIITGPESFISEWNVFLKDITSDVEPELFIGSSFLRGNAGGRYFVFQKKDRCLKLLMQ